MQPGPQPSFLRESYDAAFGARLSPNFETYMDCRVASWSKAALGYRRAGAEPLFLEAYLDVPVEQAAGAALGRVVRRGQIIEIGNFAADNGHAMIQLWGAAANDLAGQGEIAVATLTRPLRRMFARVGVPLVELAPARRERLGAEAWAWGRYYDLDPWVCAGVIADGQQAINIFLSRRHHREIA